jgi:hypothetical protein
LFVWEGFKSYFFVLTSPFLVQQLPTGLHREYFSTDDDSQTTDRAQVLVKAACDLFSMQARVNGEPLQEYFDSLRRHIVDPIEKEVDHNDPLTAAQLAEVEQARLDYAAYARAVKDDKSKQKADDAKAVLEEEETHFISYLTTRNIARCRLVTSSMAFFIQLQHQFYSNMAADYDRLASTSLPALQLCQLESRAVENKGKAAAPVNPKKATVKSVTAVAPASPAPAAALRPVEQPKSAPAPAPVVAAAEPAPAAAPTSAPAPAPAPLVVDLDFFGGGAPAPAATSSAASALFDLDGSFGAAPAAAAAPSSDPLSFFSAAPTPAPASAPAAGGLLDGLDFSASFSAPTPTPVATPAATPAAAAAPKNALDAMMAQMAGGLASSKPADPFGDFSPMTPASAASTARATSTSGTGATQHKAADWSRVASTMAQPQQQAAPQMTPQQQQAYAAAALAQMTPAQQQAYAAQMAAHQQAQWAARYKGSGAAQAPAATAPPAAAGYTPAKPAAAAAPKFEAPAHYANMENNAPKAPVVDPTDNDLRRQLRAEHQTRAEAAGQAAVNELREKEAEQQEILNQKLQLDDKVSGKINAWAGAGGKKNNIRSLLSTMENVLWEDAGWTPVPLSELMDPKKVRRVWLKAVAVVHPDKVQSSDVEHQLTAERIFNVLRDSFDSFKSELGQ